MSDDARPAAVNDTGVNDQGPDDRVLLQRYVEEDDRDALGLLFVRHADLAFRTAMRILRNPGEAEDAVQAAFMKVMRSAKEYRGGSEGVPSWIAKIVMGTCRDAIKIAVRRRKREEEVESDAIQAPVAGSGEPTQQALDAQVMQAVDELPDKYRLPVWLHHYEGLGFTEIAASLGVPEGTARTYAFRGVEILRARVSALGAAMPLPVLLTTLRQMPVESAPQTLLARLPHLAQGEAHLVGVAGGGRTVWTTGAKLAVSAAAVAVAGVAVATRLYMADKPAPAVQAPANGNRLIGAWDFNSPKLPEGLTPTKGSWHVVGDRAGTRDSAFMETDPEGDFTFVAVNVPTDKLPLRVSYRYAVVQPMPKGYPGGWAVSVFWERRGASTRFFGLGGGSVEPFPTTVGIWHSESTWVTGDYMDRWTDGGRTDLVVGKPRPDSRLLLAFRGKHRFDDLRIEAVDVKDLPDASAFVEAARQIPEDRRVGEVPMPQFKAGRRGGTVKALFAPALE